MEFLIPLVLGAAFWILIIRWIIKTRKRSGRRKQAYTSRQAESVYQPIVSCPNCKNTDIVGDVFCPNCGYKLR